MIDEKMIDKFMTIEKFLSELVGMRQEITDLKSSEAQGRMEIARLREYEGRIRSLMDHLPQRIFLKDRNSAYLFANETFGRDLHRDVSEIAGKSDYDLFPPETAERFISDDRRILESGIAEEREETYRTAAGDRLMHMIKTPLRNPSGEVFGLSGIFWDITEQKKAEEDSKRDRERLEQLLSERSAELGDIRDQLRAEKAERDRIERELQEKVEEQRRMAEEILFLKEALETSQAKFHFMMDHLPVGIWITLDEKLVFVNAKGVEILGYSQGELDARRFSELVYPEDQKMIEERYTGWLSGKTPPNIFASRFVHKDGTIRWLENKIAVIQWEGKRGIVNFAVDITDRKWARGELRNSIDQFRGVVNSLEEVLLTWDRENH